MSFLPSLASSGYGVTLKCSFSCFTLVSFGFYSVVFPLPAVVRASCPVSKWKVVSALARRGHKMTGLRYEKPFFGSTKEQVHVLRPPTLPSPPSLYPLFPRGGFPRDVYELERDLLWEGGPKGDTVLLDVFFLLHWVNVVLVQPGFFQSRCGIRLPVLPRIAPGPRSSPPKNIFFVPQSRHFCLLALLHSSSPNPHTPDFPPLFLLYHLYIFVTYCHYPVSLCLIFLLLTHHPHPH